MQTEAEGARDEELVRRHAPLAAMLAARFSRHRREVDELTQVAMVGLWNAARRFDPDRGVAFETFAWRTIVGMLKRHKRDHAWMIRPPRSSHDSFLAVSAVVEDLTHELGRSPTVGEISERSGIPEEKVALGLEVLHRATTDSLERSESAHDEPTPFLARHELGFDRAADRSELARLMAVLTPREREIVALRFFADLTQSAIGRRVGCSQMHVSRTLTTALAKLRRAAETAA